MEQLEGKTAVITGAASGIGFAMTEQFLRDGMRVVMADIEEGALVAAAERLTASGGAASRAEDVLAVPTDVTDIASVHNLRDEALRAYGAVHVVCNNAGVAPGGPMLETTADDWAWVMGVNVNGVAHGVVTFGPLLVEQGEGHIVNTASIAGFISTEVLGLYCASKHAVVGLTESLWRELQGTGVGVSVLCPNLVKTQIFESERNRPAAVTQTASQTETMGMLRETIDAVGLGPDVVAAAVADGIRANRFWILTHPGSEDLPGIRAEDVRLGRDPSPPFPDQAPGAEDA